jgi:hypothetical protein
MRQLGQSRSARNKSAFIDGMPATEDSIAQNPMDKHSKKTKVMLQEADSIAVLSLAANPRVDEAKEVSVSAPVIDFFDACDQKPGPHNASCREAERLPEIVYLTRKRERKRLIDTVEDSLYLLLLAAALGYLLIAFLGV